MNDRMILLKRVQVCDFALNDAALFLDTHPEDKDALDFYKKHLRLREEAAKEYTSKYGPITKADYDGGPRWTWIDGPWPWQNEEA
ncbi:MAG: spore coat protein CotJB [Oscillospiraceae bacterium]|nr:spore coat protein CotJB [Oscillospiraceae bacterium]